VDSIVKRLYDQLDRIMGTGTRGTQQDATWCLNAFLDHLMETEPPGMSPQLHSLIHTCYIAQGLCDGCGAALAVKTKAAVLSLEAKQDDSSMDVDALLYHQLHRTLPATMGRSLVCRRCALSGTSVPLVAITSMTVVPA
jgi:hypothetical protein